MKNLILAATSLVALSTVSTSASAGDDLSVQTGIDFVSQYVFRGTSRGDNAIQATVETSTHGVTLGAKMTSSMGSGINSIALRDEIDLSIGYALPISDDYTVDLGATYYYYPQFGNLFKTSGGLTGSFEIDGGISFTDQILAPTVNVAYDFNLNALTIQGGVSHSVELGDTHSLDLGLNGGLVDYSGGAPLRVPPAALFGSLADYEWVTISGAVAHHFNEDVAAHFGANFTLNSHKALNTDKILSFNPKKDLFWIGAGVTAGF